MNDLSDAFARALAVFVDCLVERGVISIQDSVGTADSPLAEEVVERKAADLDRKTVDEYLPVDDHLMQEVVAGRLRWLLKKRGETQAQLAKRIGVSPASISRILNDPESAKVGTLRKVAKALEEDLNRIL